MKKIFLLIVVLLLCSIGCSFAEESIEPAPESDFIYTVNGSEVQIDGYQGLGGIVKIPDTIDGLPVTRIANKAFYEENCITGIVFPKKLSSIGEQAFCFCKNLSGVLLFPPELQVIEEEAFWCCNEVKGVVITSDCSIEFGAFVMSGMKFLYITEENAPTLEGSCHYTLQTTEAIIPMNAEIERGAFQITDDLTIYTPTGSKAVEYARKNGIQVNTKDYEQKKAEYEQMYRIKSEVTTKSTSEQVIKPTDEQSLESSFTPIQSGDTRVIGLYKYNIKGNGTVSIIDYDWENSSGDIYIPSMLDGYAVTTISEESFANGKEKNKEDVLIVIPDSINMIGEKAFYNSPVSTISIPASVQSIGKAAFAYCDITQFIVDQKQPNYTTVDGVLYDKRNKALFAHPQKKPISNKIPEGILSISEYAFSGMTIGQKDSSTLCFTDILPSTLTKIEPHAFENCTLYYSSNETTDNSLTLLPKGLSEIGEYAFAGCVFKSNHSAPEKIVLAEELDEIGDYAFSDCKFSDDFDFELVISKSEMSRIGKHAFASSVTGNQKMNVRIVLPDAVDEIGENAFFETHPVRINEKAEIRTLGPAAFQNTIVYTGMKESNEKNETPKSLCIYGKIKKIPSMAFADKLDDSLNTVETIIIQEGITTIEESAFAGRKNLQTVSLPMTLVEIDNNAFSDCQRLLEINIPESVLEIGDNVFDRQYITLIVTENSYAALWASENGYNYRYLENNDGLDWLNSDIH